MDDVRLILLETIEKIETRPLMFCSSDSYYSISDWIMGYFHGVEAILKIDLNLKFTNWVASRSISTSMFWTGQILKIMADNNESKARQILFTELKLFLRSM